MLSAKTLPLRPENTAYRSFRAAAFAAAFGRGGFQLHGLIVLNPEQATLQWRRPALCEGRQAGDLQRRRYRRLAGKAPQNKHVQPVRNRAGRTPLCVTERLQKFHGSYTVPINRE